MSRGTRLAPERAALTLLHSLWANVHNTVVDATPILEDPGLHVRAAANATRASASVVAHAALSRWLGWAEPATLGKAVDDLAAVSATNSVLIDVADANVAVGEVWSRLVASAMTIADGYEAILAMDWRVGGIGDQHTRRALGAFHTPQELAEAVVRRTADVMVAHRFGRDVSHEDPAVVRYLAELTVADLAVGAGRFPVAWLREIERRARNLGDRRALSGRALLAFEMTDVDPVALELARIAVAIELDDPQVLSDIGRTNVRLGNALLPSDPYVARGRGDWGDVGVIWDPANGVDHFLSPVDVVLGNPPWERIRVEPRHLLRGLIREVAEEDQKAAREILMGELPDRFPQLSEYLAGVVKSTHLGVDAIRRSSVFRLSGKGELYTHQLFVELGLSRVSERSGWVSQLVKSAMLSNAGGSPLMAHNLEQGRIWEAWEFVNTARIFQIDSRERFALLIAGPTGSKGVRVAAGLTESRQIGDESLSSLVDDDLRLRLDPKEGRLPICSSSAVGLLSAVADFPRIDDVAPELRFGRLLHLTNHSDAIHKEPGPDRLPVLEGRMIEQFTSRFAGFDDIPPAVRWSAKVRAKPSDDHALSDPHFVPGARWWVDEQAWRRVSSAYPEPFSLVWRNASSPFNRRTMLATVTSAQPTIQSLQILQADAAQLVRLCALFNSLVFDWLVRRMMPGIDVTASVVRRIPVLPEDAWTSSMQFFGVETTLEAHVASRVARLLTDDARNWPLWGAERPDAVVDTVGRRVLRREIDVLICRAYGLTRDQWIQVLDDFPTDVSDPERGYLLANGPQ